MTSSVEGQIEFEHFHRYCLARDLCVDRDVLDVAAGEGYGSAILATVARSVIGVEIDADTVSHAKTAYPLANLAFERGDALALPLGDASVDVVTSFETLEHVGDHDRFLGEVRRVLRPGGLFIVSTPDRTVYSAYGSEPNPYHVFELTEAEFRELLGKHFARTIVTVQRPVLGSVITGEGDAGWRSYERRSLDVIEATNGLARAPYLIALVSDEPLPSVPSSVYLDRRRVHDVVQTVLDHDALQARMAALAGEADAARSQVIELRRDLERREQREAAMLREGEEARADFARLSEALLKRERQEVGLLTDRDEARAEVATLRGALAQRERQEAALLTDREEARAEAAALREALAQRESQEALLVRQRDGAWGDAGRMREALAEKERQLAQLTSEKDGAQSEIIRLLEEAHRRASHEQTLKIEREVARTDVAHLTAAVSYREQLLERERALAEKGEQRTGTSVSPLAGLRRRWSVRRSRASLIDRIRRSKLFDKRWYRKQIGETSKLRDPLAHYVDVGERMGLSPHALFDPGFYRAAATHDFPPGANALDHYLSTGVLSRAKPHPLFDPTYYLDQGARLPAGADPLAHYLAEGWRLGFQPHPLFDGSFYLAANSDVASKETNPLLHYLTNGWREGRKPHPLFDPAYYLAQQGDVAASGQEPLSHYVTSGSLEGRQPNPLFDPAHYRRVYQDVAASGLEPIAHFQAFGWRERRRPHPLFDTEYYLRLNSDVADQDIEPLAEFLDGGWRRGASPHYLFDAVFYREANLDIAEADINPLIHFLLVGWRENRSPHPLFDVAFYRAANADVAASGMDPLSHYLSFGWQEGRKPHPLFDPTFYLERHPDVHQNGIEPLGDFLAHGAAGDSDPHPLFDVAYYRRRVEPPLPPSENALLHYLREGARQGIAPHPLFHVAGYKMDQRDLSHFGENALLHYLVEGSRSGARPHPLFDPALYEKTYPDVATSGLTSFEHYVRWGRHAKRRCSELLLDGQTLADAHLALPLADNAAVAVIIPAYRSYGDTYRCLYSIAATAERHLPAQIVLADDCPWDPLTPLFGAVPNLSILAHPENLGFLRSCNRAAALTPCQYLVFLNNDTTVRPGWLRSLVELAGRDPLVAMVGSKLLNADGSVQEAGGVMFKDGWGYPYGRNDDKEKPEYNFVREVDCVIGACFLVRRDYFERVGGLDERYSPAFFEEFDLAMAFADAGYKVMYQPASEVFHIGSSSYGAEIRDRQSVLNHEKFAEKWAARLSRRPEGPADLFLARDKHFPSGCILVIDDAVPEYNKHAGALTLLQYLKLFVRLGFKVIYFPHDRKPRQPYTSTLQQTGIEVLYGALDIRQWLSAYGHHLAYVWVARPIVAHDVLDDILSLTKAKVLYYTHDLHFLRERRRYELDGDSWAKHESERLLPIEMDIFNRVDCVLTPSSEEVEEIRRLAPEATIRVITPYIFDDAVGLVAPGSPSIEERRDIIFVGGYAHIPNVDAVVRLARDIMPLVWESVPDAKLLVLGSNPPPEVLGLAGPRVDVVGFVPELGPWYSRARVSVSPLRWGAGVKGKVVESLVAKVPVVTTMIGNEGIALKHGTEVLVGEGDRELADHVITLFHDPMLLKRISEAGPQVISARFSERTARDQLLDALELAICNICGHRYAQKDAVPVVSSGARNWREEPNCPACWALNRMTAVAETLLRPYRDVHCSSVHEVLPYLREQRIHEFGFVGPLQDQLKTLPRFSCSDYFPGRERGEVVKPGVLNEDLCALSFEDRSFDLSISQEVLEHVPEPLRAFREIFRTLKPGGRHVMSVPYDPQLETSRTRCALVDGELIHYLSPEYHGDPIRSEGALVFTDFGLDLVESLESVGFQVEVYETHHSEVRGGYIAIFACQRPMVGA